MITLQKLKWSNCFSYGPNNELDLQSNTVTQLVGTNGMGKSSIPLIIEEALYNKNSKGIKKADIPNRYVNEGYHIHLEFTKEDTKYDVIIDRKSSIKLRLLENGEDISPTLLPKIRCHSFLLALFKITCCYCKSD